MVSLKLLEKFLYYFNIYYVFMFFILNDFYIQMRRDQERIRLTRYTIRLIFILLYLTKLFSLYYLCIQGKLSYLTHCKNDTSLT